MSAVTHAVRWLLWKLLGRDCLVLRPGWTVRERADQFMILSPKVEAQRTLPITYNGCTPKSWQLRYEIHGRDHGPLRYRLAAPGKPAFCELNAPVQLPWILDVRLENNRLLANDRELPLIPGTTVPRDATCLVGEFLFEPNGSSPAYRHTAHRVDASGDSSDPSYFQGSVYEDYDARPGMFPDEIFATVARHRPVQGHFLDVGCATGLLVERAAARGLVAEGIDVSEWAVAKANERTPASCRVLNFNTATATDFKARYDIIVLHSVLEHLTNPEQSLRLLHDLLVPGGIVYVQTLNANSLMHQVRGQDWSGYADYTHCSPWITAAWLKKTSLALGFNVLETKCYGVWNENPFDEAWQSLATLLQLPPVNALLEAQLGDFVEIVLQRPTLSP